jgi:hypothetical protein
LKILVCGGSYVGRAAPDGGGDITAKDMARATYERQFVSDYLDKMHAETPITQIIGGKEGGAERIGLHWARVNEIPISEWNRRKFPKLSLLSPINLLGKKARSSRHTLETREARNARMLAGSKPDLVLAFSGGPTTKILIDDARNRGFRVIEVDIPALSPETL